MYRSLLARNAAARSLPGGCRCGSVSGQRNADLNLDRLVATERQSCLSLGQNLEVVVDGNRLKDYRTIPHECVVKGDGKYYAIAAASVLAKTHRDEYMLEIDLEYPQYNWASNKGYPTRDHKDAINLHGITSYHRKSFNMNEQLKLGL